MRNLIKKFLFGLLIAGSLAACDGPTAPNGDMYPAFYRGFGVPEQITSRITIANYDGQTEWFYEITTDRAGVLVRRTVQAHQVEHVITCNDIDNPHGLTEITWTAEVDGRDGQVSANLNC